MTDEKALGNPFSAGALQIQWLQGVYYEKDAIYGVPEGPFVVYIEEDNELYLIQYP
ncbi:MAG: hypothetical protein H6555_07900 [Lewinellaceae bacterium]|nr:hypothetical protein [Lewinellaceae bacterium]